MQKICLIVSLILTFALRFVRPQISIVSTTGFPSTARRKTSPTSPTTVNSDDYYIEDDFYYIDTDDEDYKGMSTPDKNHQAALTINTINTKEAEEDLKKKSVSGKDYGTTPDKELIVNMTLELAREAYFLVRQLDVIRQNHMNTLAYSIGIIMGKIREKYRKLVAFYAEAKARISFDNKPKRSSLYGHNSMKEFRPYVFQYYYQYCREVERDIESMIDMLEKINEKDIGGIKRYLRYKEDLEKSAVQEGKRRIIEQLKRRNRQHYLKKKLGLNDSSELPNRHFKDGWPVDELDELQLFFD